ncbi:MAK10-like protein [Tanacetum coccineum]
MRDENSICTLGDYSKPSHEGYRNTIELPDGNNVVPLRSDTVWLVQNGFSFRRLRSEDPNEHLKDFLKLVDSLNLDVANRERTRLRLFQFSLRDQASNWLERLPARSISTWEDLTTRFLAQFFPPRRTLQVQIFYDHVNPVTRRTIDQSICGKLHDKNAKESWALLEDLALYDNESWNDPRDFTKPVKAISLPQDVPSTSDCRLIKLENQVQRLMEDHLAPKQPIQVNKISSSCEICSGLHDTQYCMENPKQAFVDYASLRTDEAGGKWFTFKPKQNNLGDTYNPSWKSHPNLSLVPQSSDTKFVCTKEDGEDVMFIKIIKKYDDSRKEDLEGDENIITGGLEAEYFDIFPTRSELAYHKKLDPREDPYKGVSNFTRMIKGMHIFIGNFTYVSDFMIAEDISSIIDPRLSQVVLGKPFVKVSNMTYDLSLGVVKFTHETNEIAYKMPHKIEQYNSLSNLEKEHMKSVYLRNEEDKRRGVDYVINKILGFYKECLELGLEYLNGLENEGGVT